MERERGGREDEASPGSPGSDLERQKLGLERISASFERGLSLLAELRRSEGQDLAVVRPALPDKPSPHDEVDDPGRRILLMVAELHTRGYERLRIAPGMSGSGCCWRCAVTPVTNITRSHGAMLSSWPGLAAHYTSPMQSDLFGSSETRNLSLAELADWFIDRYPEIVETGRGPDPEYAAWYAQMLKSTEFYLDLPIAYADYQPEGTLCASMGHDLPLPPGGWGPEY